MQTNPRITLRPRRAKPFVYRHPWVFSGAIGTVKGSPEDGDAVDVFDDAGKFIARGFFNSKSQIQVRLFTWNEEEELDQDFFARRIQRAVDSRRCMQQAGILREGEAYRLLNSEGDFLSGLVVDVYPPLAVIQFLSLGLACRKEMLIDLIQEIGQVPNLYERSDGPVCEYEGMEGQVGTVRGERPPDYFEMIENGQKLLVNLRRGHKTGHYLDQRENRALARQLAFGGKVLDVCCYTGSFGIHAAGESGQLLGIDESGFALETAAKNAERNGFEPDRAEFRKGSAVPEMRKLLEAGERFGTVIVDPPKFAHSRREVGRASHGYRELNGLAIQLVEPGGMLFACSCSGAVDVATFQSFLHEAAYAARRDIQILERRSQAADHPVALACPESRYLKCFVCRIH